MVNDPELEREEIGGREPMGDPAEKDPHTQEGVDDDADVEPDETLTEGTPARRSEREGTAP